ncbi:hypothetical protein DJICPGNB_26020 [Escherichia coli]|nr:hypothetical protein DJICPGNB_26020 [Escherichia coli]
MIAILLIIASFPLRRVAPTILSKVASYQLTKLALSDEGKKGMV